MARVEVKRFWLNRLLCWHGKKHLKLLMSSNGAQSYCGKCFRKKTGIHDFDFEGGR